MLTVQDEKCDGCGRSECDDKHLCDVVMPAQPCPPSRAPFEAWEAEYRRDYMSEQVHVPDEIKADACSIWTMAQEPTFKNRYSGRDAVVMLIQAGLDLTGAAHVLGTTPEALCRKFSKQNHDASKWLVVEEMLRDGVESYQDVADRTGIDVGSIKRMADLLGLKSRTAARQSQGGGLKYSAEQRAQAREMREAGMGYAAISRATGIGYHAVVGMFRKRKR